MLFQSDMSRSKGSWSESSVCFAEHTVVIQREATASESMPPLAEWSGGPDRRRIKLNPGSQSVGVAAGGLYIRCWWFFIPHASQRRAMSPAYVRSYWHLRRYLSNPRGAAAGQIRCDHMWAPALNVRPEDVISESLSLCCVSEEKGVREPLIKWQIYTNIGRQQNKNGSVNHHCIISHASSVIIHPHALPKIIPNVQSRIHQARADHLTKTEFADRPTSEGKAASNIHKADKYYSLLLVLYSHQCKKFNI